MLKLLCVVAKKVTSYKVKTEEAMEPNFTCTKILIKAMFEYVITYYTVKIHVFKEYDAFKKHTMY